MAQGHLFERRNMFWILSSWKCHQSRDFMPNIYGQAFIESFNDEICTNISIYTDSWKDGIYTYLYYWYIWAAESVKISNAKYLGGGSLSTMEAWTSKSSNRKFASQKIKLNVINLINFGLISTLLYLCLFSSSAEIFDTTDYLD